MYSNVVKGGEYLSGRVSRLKASEMLGGRYRIISVLGAGGMGAVYLAEDLRLKGKCWAIKESFRSSVDIKQFIDEAEILIKLNHPYLPNIIDYFPPNEVGYSYLVMDYIQGKTLMQVFEEEQKSISYQRILKYCIQICDLFGYLHGNQPKPIIYRDLKPSNVMIDQQDNVRLIDFGIARNYQLGQHSDTIPLGTIGFAAPEQFEQLQTDHRTDLYNLGAMMYFLISGGHYFYLLQKPITEYRDDLPDNLDKVIDNLLMLHPDERYQSAFKVKKELESCGLKTKSYQGLDLIKQPVIKPKIIVIGSLYVGAGSTFVSMAVARILHHCQIPNSVVEYPTIEPELYSILFGEKWMPKDYQYLTDQLYSDFRIKDQIEWNSGRTIWYPLDPKGPEHIEWIENNSYKLLFAAKNPMIIIDVSDRWFDVGVQELCKESDEIMFVADFFPHKFNKQSSQQRFNYAFQLREQGKSVNFIANRDLKSSARKEWIQSFPWRPICFLPNIEYDKMIQTIWKGKIVQDHPEIYPKLFNSMLPWLTRILPKEHINRTTLEL